MNNRKDEIQQEFYTAITTGNIQSVKTFLEPNDGVECVNPAANENHAVTYAAKYGQLEILKLLLACDGINPQIAIIVQFSGIF